MVESGKDVERSGFFFSKVLTTFSQKRKKNSKRQYGNNGVDFRQHRCAGHPVPFKKFI